MRLVGLAQASDREIWDYARTFGFVIVSLDADFADRAILNGAPPKVIWLRCGNQSTEFIERLLRNHAQIIETFERAAAACLEIY